MPRSGVISLDLRIESFPPQKSKNLLGIGVYVPHLYNTSKSQF